VWFTESGTRGVIGRITPAGLITEFEVAGEVSGDLADITTGADGRVWFAEPSANKIARFEPPPLTVVVSGDQVGTVTSVGGEIDCGFKCTHRMTTGAKFTLTANPGTDAIFTGWFGGGCAGTSPCTVNSATTVTATFQRLHNVVFVTSTTTAPGDFKGLSGADEICRGRAAAGRLSGNYVAWLSTSTVNAKERLFAARGWIRPDGRPFADTVDDIVNGRIYYPPNVDESGQQVPDVRVAEVATGTWLDGLRDPWNTAYCGDWNDSAGSVEAGDAFGGTFLWTASQTKSCSQPLRLYCFGVDDATALAPARVDGRVAFVSYYGVSAGAGVAAADTLCQTEAGAHGLPGSYRALLATTYSPAAQRFSTAGAPWVRPDGIPITATAASLSDASLLAPFTQDAGGAYYGARLVWTGATGAADTTTLSSTCSDWTDSVNGAGLVGRTGTASHVFFYSGSGIACSGAQAVHCLQQ
jgi:hypothetical protein